MNQEVLETMYELLEAARIASDMPSTMHGTSRAFDEAMERLKAAVEKVDDLCGTQKRL